MFLSFCDREVLNGISSLLYDRIYFITVFPLILYRRRELNIGNRITFFSAVLWVCNYQLTLSYGDF